MDIVQLGMAGVFDDVSFGDVQVGSGNYSTSAPTPTTTSSSEGGGMMDGFNIMNVLNLVGGTWAQLEAAKNGKPVMVKNSSGQPQNIAPQLLDKLEQQAAANNTSSNQMLQMMQMQMMKQNQAVAPVKDNTALYVGLGVGALVLMGGVLYVSTKKSK